MLNPYETEQELAVRISALQKTLIDIASLAHTSANGGLKTAGKRETVGQIKCTLRQIRDMAYKELRS